MYRNLRDAEGSDEAAVSKNCRLRQSAFNITLVLSIFIFHLYLLLQLPYLDGWNMKTRREETMLTTEHNASVYLLIVLIGNMDEKHDQMKKQIYVIYLT